MWHYARGTAFASLDRRAEAEREYDSLRVVARDPALDELVLLSGSSARDLLAIAERVLAAEIARVRGESEDETQRLREAVRVQDSLPYTEPPPWYFPVRHALGAALLRAGRAYEAEEVFRDDLDRNPRSGWSLFGLAMSLRAQGQQTAAASVEREFEQAWPRADVSPAAFYE
jgi:tetratricopeptide (TPR) repeat protein